MEHFGVGNTKAALGLALYVLGCLLFLPILPWRLTDEDRWNGSLDLVPYVRNPDLRTQRAISQHLRHLRYPLRPNRLG